MMIAVLVMVLIAVMVRSSPSPSSSSVLDERMLCVWDKHRGYYRYNRIRVTWTVYVRMYVGKKNIYARTSETQTTEIVYCAVCRLPWGSLQEYMCVLMVHLSLY